MTSQVMSEPDVKSVNHQEGSPLDQRKRFRFKNQNGRSTRSRDDVGSADSNRQRHRHYHPSHHRSKRTRAGTRSSGQFSLQDNPSQDIEPDRAFQESLFDALGDDEGADFWQGVYGQPIHTYPKTYVDEHSGELEQMDDDQYAQYVRRRMWEKSREGIEAAKEARKLQRQKEKEHEDQQQYEKPPAREAYNNFAFDFEIEASLRRGQRRKDQKRWQDLWTAYLKNWEDLRGIADFRDTRDDAERLLLRNRIVWPVESGRRKDVNAEEIERFIKRGTESLESEKKQPLSGLLAAIKQERVRWHPDKIQHRYGFMQIDDLTMQGVTATFQVFDRMWNESKGSQER